MGAGQRLVDWSLDALKHARMAQIALAHLHGARPCIAGPKVQEPLQTPNGPGGSDEVSWLGALLSQRHQQLRQGAQLHVGDRGGGGCAGGCSGGGRGGEGEG